MVAENINELERAKKNYFKEMVDWVECYDITVVEHHGHLHATSCLKKTKKSSQKMVFDPALSSAKAMKGT